MNVQLTDMARHALQTAYDAATDLVLATPELHSFAGWPQAQFAATPATPMPGGPGLAAWQADETTPALALHDAIRAAVPFARWQHTYTEEEVGRDFLNRYGWFELAGPYGHFRTDEMRAYIAYWGEGLEYPFHLHEAEELYYVISGQALFEAEGQPSAVLRAGDTRLHLSNQPHAMRTLEAPILTLVLWRGGGLHGAARMGTQ